MSVDNEFESAFNDASGEPAEASEAATQSSSEADREDGDAFEETAGTGETGGEETGGETGGEETGGETGGEETGGETGSGEAGAEEAGAEERKPAGGEQPTPQGALNEEALAAAYRRLREEEQAAEHKAGEQEEVSPLDKTWKDYLSDDDKAIVEEYEKEWSEVSRAEQIKRQAELQHVQDVVYSNVRSALAPIVEQLQQSKVEAHFNSIRSRVPEFDDIREPVQEWVKEQPEFVRPAFEQVLKQGSADQVVELLNAYKQAKGTTGAAPEVPASSASKGQQPAKPKRPAPSGAAKRAMAAAPSQKRSNPPSQTDPNDFASAFDEAAAGGI